MKTKMKPTETWRDWIGLRSEDGDGGMIAICIRDNAGVGDWYMHGFIGAGGIRDLALWLLDQAASMERTP